MDKMSARKSTKMLTSGRKHMILITPGELENPDVLIKEESFRSFAFGAIKFAATM